MLLTPTMFDFLAPDPSRRSLLCGGHQHSRRDFLNIGALTAAGLSLPQLLAAKQAGAVKPGHDNRACIMIF
ncbi:MAG: hypothetical protein P8J87_09020, partial [Verrucomicrobiales bacterium]|nr:hypothetical protein [Verrucomicrobiales bacterium]